ncbi:putative signal recognition particle protein [Tetrabaena socialis]|uniref:Signal recognition particle subunit SRP68 n=1 Tax=Tetrabaena socialis TaxID=47790 RepID=A0A2J7ZR18_9CHLO|nr:putative signal recognition particle protein [Tetrabaena socialis]|eukprot:PNH02715.1 putative signal recognition particle protein [Tetrabaena socialis]
MAEPESMEVDLTTGAEGVEAAPALLGPLPLNLLSTIKAAQAQNGLRHGDYMRYRKHCASRLQSLYKLLKMQHGRTKYQKRKLDVHNITDVK